MELYVPRLPSRFFFHIATAYCAFLLIPYSVCLDMQYEYCQTTGRTCGSTNFTYPFGVGTRGCGLPASFQIDCVQNSNPVIKIDGRNYTILKIYYDTDDFVIFRNDSCQFLNDPIDIRLDYVDAVFRVTGKTNWTLNVFQGNKSVQDTAEEQFRQCNDSVYYSFSFDVIPRASIRQVSVEVVRISWVTTDTKRAQICRSCEASGGICGYRISNSTAATPFVCYCSDGPRAEECPGPGVGNKSAIIVGCSFGGVALTAIAVIFFTFYAKRRRTQPSQRSSLEVEKFLREYAHQMPTRYSHAHLKKITNSFAEKLGEGGFGVVYKGKFRSGTLVAVKLLDRQRQSEVQFMTEVATIGRLHHVNLVRLLGYCFENPISALVYEYMVNGSLDKFIFARKEEGQMLKRAQLYSIALGAARGIAYLHQDCEKRIIHFDIKPHNILLDADFTPKVSDFGLAKLCEKEEDHVSMTAWRGTPGYVAPEVCDRDVGPVTDKSDVYSFGIVLLEMVGGRWNIDWKVSRSSQFYFPEWACKLIESGDLGMMLGGSETEAEDEEKARRLTKVGLWCTQYKSTDRPCMTRIVQMLEGNGDDVAYPPLQTDMSSSACEIPVLSRTKNFQQLKLHPETPPLSRTEESSSYIVDM